jgi:hypothetical protein
MAPIRPQVHVLVDFEGDGSTLTLREAVDWYKQLLRADLGVPTEMEKRYINERWGVLISSIAKREQLPAGLVSYMLAEIAQTEVRLLKTAQEEAAAAVEYGR